MRPKDWKRKEPLDKLIRQTLRMGMHDGAPVFEIHFVYGFEKFGSYESWEGGYRVVDHKNQLSIEDGDLDGALFLWAKAVENEDLGPYQHYRKHYELHYKPMPISGCGG